MASTQSSVNPTKDDRLEEIERAQSSEDAPVLFLLPGLGGSQQLLQGVAQVIPIRYPDWTEIVKPDRGFLSLYHDVKSQIDRRGPTGSFSIAGYSAGGPLAYACALAFQSEGRPVRCLAILDAAAYLEHIPPPLRYRVRSRVERMCTLDLRAALASPIAKLCTRKRAEPFLLRAARFRHVALPLNFDVYLHNKIRMQLLRRLFWSWWRPLVQSSPQLLTPTYVFRSEEHEPFEREDLGWGDYCSNVNVLNVAGSHHGMINSEVSGTLCSALLEISGIATENNSKPA
jgi:thioesterase domain-containing protein